MLNWIIKSHDGITIQSASFSDTADAPVCLAIEACVDKAVQLLKNNIQDDSLYFLFEWDSAKAILSIVVTDSSKQRDAPHSVYGHFPELETKFLTYSSEQRSTYSDQIKYWLHDYLTVCTEFLSYSLVAIFHCSTRNNTDLL